MGKRSDFKRRPQDAYDTPAAAVGPLLEHLPKGSLYLEPCAGNGSLIRAIGGHAVCVKALDIEPRGEDVVRQDTLRAANEWAGMGAEYIITNPPWTRVLMHQMIQQFSDMLPTWLLFDADWVHTKQATPHLWRLRKIVSVGRVSWMQNGTSGKDNCQWHLFDAKALGQARFFGRAA